MDERRSRLLRAAWWIVPAMAAWAWYATMATHVVSRIRSLRCVENYGFAVFDQVLYNAATTGIFSQTIHFGYVDSWMWSGHRSLWMRLLPQLYALDPGPEFLAKLQVGLVALGAFPAFGLGFRAIGGPIGGLCGTALYLAYPPLMAVARQDFQDLVLGIPFAMLAIHQCRRRSTAGFLLAGFSTCMAREDWAFMVPLIGLAYPGSLRQRGLWLLRGVVIASVYGALIWWMSRSHQGYDNQAVSHLGGLSQGIRWSRSWEDFHRFYSGFLQPVHAIGFLAPLTLFPAAGAMFLHLTAPAQGGVDTQWTGHIHHMAPVVVFVVAATIDAVGLGERLLSRLPRGRNLVRGVLLLVGGAWILHKLLVWMVFLQITPTLALPTDSSPPRAAEWTLAAQVPEGATVATDPYASLTVSSRTGSYTYTESLADKTRGRGLEAVEFLMVRKTDLAWVKKAQDAGATEVSATPHYTLYRLPWAAE